MTANSDLPQGTLDLLILKVAALGPVHGYAIARFRRAR
jgi:DNA-binding PadR family transcriptional regulator